MCDYCVYPLVARFNFYNILEDKYIYIYILKFNIPLQKKKKKKKKKATLKLMYLLQIDQTVSLNILKKVNHFHISSPYRGQ